MPIFGRLCVQRLWASVPQSFVHHKRVKPCDFLFDRSTGMFFRVPQRLQVPRKARNSRPSDFRHPLYKTAYTKSYKWEDTNLTLSQCLHWFSECAQRMWYESLACRAHGCRNAIHSIKKTRLGEHMCARLEGKHYFEPTTLQMRARCGNTHSILENVAKNTPASDTATYTFQNKLENTIRVHQKTKHASSRTVAPDESKQQHANAMCVI